MFRLAFVDYRWSAVVVVALTITKIVIIFLVITIKTYLEALFYRLQPYNAEEKDKMSHNDRWLCVTTHITQANVQNVFFGSFFFFGTTVKLPDQTTLLTH